MAWLTRPRRAARQLHRPTPAPAAARRRSAVAALAGAFFVSVPADQFQQTRQDLATFITAPTLLAGSPIYYVWYVDGAHVATTQSPNYAVFIDPPDQVQVDCIETLDPNFNADLHAPVAYPARRTLAFVRSLDAGIYQYRIEQQIEAGGWAVLAYLFDRPGTWQYTYLTPRLTDLTNYAWRVIPMDAAGNDGTAVTLDSELIVRTPDAPAFSATFDQAHDKVTFAAA